SYLTQSRDLSSAAAGYAVSGYWLGLTLGRFLISPAAERAGLPPARMMYGCLAGAAALSAVAWMAPGPVSVSVALAGLGFCLGPVFPTMMAVTPRLARPGLVPTAIGVMNSGSVIGGSALPWLAGVIAQGSGMWTLLPYAIVLALLQVAIWRPLAARLTAPPACQSRLGGGASRRPGEPERRRRSA
ncbi:MAG: MFS transporter, partial [Streptosporangiales bacterium]|nr:MFS transporter [Streptosporangiales bacterium]